VLSIIRRAGVLFKEKPWLIFIFFALLAVFLRWSTFYQSLLDLDESLYLLVAKAWLEGAPPYTTIWDNKPPGVYVLFLIAISVLGHSVLSIRILACLFVAITSFFLYKIGSLIDVNGRRIGLLSGILYVIATLSNGGMASNTEIFFTPFVVIAFYLFFTNRFHARELFSKDYMTLFLIGFLLGIGFEIKYVVLFDFLALSIILVLTFILQIRSNIKYWLIFKTISFLLLGFILPVITVSLYFWLTGHFDDYVYANFTANKLRTVDIELSFITPLEALFQQIRYDKIFWLSIPSGIIYLFVTKAIPTRERFILSSFMAWFFITSICIFTVFRSSFYPHYFLQLSPPLCLVTAYISIRLIFQVTTVKQSKFRQYLVLVIFLILLIKSTMLFEALDSNTKYVYFRNFKGIKNWGDTSALITDYLKPRIKSNDYIYIVNQVPIVYFLTDAKIPTRYAFPPFLMIQDGLPNITGVNPPEELERILQKQPVYVVKLKTYPPNYANQNKIFLNKLNQTLDNSYQREISIDGLDLYRLNPKP
jgi:4-amino-4-deoxy-L-arabinose transferase-like glycosyltransferase